MRALIASVCSVVLFMRSKKIAQSLNRSKIVNDFRAIQAICAAR
jgi:hypothetical protein